MQMHYKYVCFRKKTLETFYSIRYVNVIILKAFYPFSGTYEILVKDEKSEDLANLSW